MSAYIDYGYDHADNPSGQVGEQLARQVTATLVAAGVRGVVCDLGCGNGYLSRMLARAGFQVIGVDASASGIDQARHADSEIRFICGEIHRDAPWTRTLEPFDAVVSSEVIEHLYRPAALIETASRLLAPRGTLLLTTPYHGFLKNLALILSGRFDRHFDPLWDGGHIKFFSPQTLTRLLRDHGFDPLQLRYHGRCPGLWRSMICTARASPAATDTRGPARPVRP